MNRNETVHKNGRLSGRRLRRLCSRLEIDTRTHRRGEPDDNEEDAKQKKTVDGSMSQDADQEAAHDLVNINSISISTGTTLWNENRRRESPEHVHCGSLNTAEQNYPVRIGWTHGRPIRTTTRERRRRNDDSVEIRRTERQTRGIAPRGHGNEQGSSSDPTGFELEKRLRDERISELGWRKDPHGSRPLGDEPVRISAAPIGSANMINAPRGRAGIERDVANQLSHVIENRGRNSDFAGRRRLNRQRLAGRALGTRIRIGNRFTLVTLANGACRSRRMTLTDVFDSLLAHRLGLVLNTQRIVERDGAVIHGTFEVGRGVDDMGRVGHALTRNVESLGNLAGRQDRRIVFSQIDLLTRKRNRRLNITITVVTVVTDVTIGGRSRRGNRNRRRTPGPRGRLNSTGLR